MESKEARRLPAVMIVVAAMLTMYNLTGVLFFVNDRSADFHSFYQAAMLWRRGLPAHADAALHLPNNLNHPIMPPIWLPFMYWSFETAAMLWTLLSIGLALWCIAVAARIAGLSARQLALVVFGSVCTMTALGLGQVTFVLAPVLTLAWLSDRRGSTTRAAAWLALLTVAKPFFALFGLYVLRRREWRASLAYGLVIAGGYVVGFWFVGVAGYRNWLAVLSDVSWQWHVYNASIWGLADRWFLATDAPIVVGWTPLLVAPRLAYATVFLAAVAVLVFLWLKLGTQDLDASYALVGLAAILLSPLGWLYYVPVLTAPIASVLSRRASPLLWPLGNPGGHSHGRHTRSCLWSLRDGPRGIVTFLGTFVFVATRTGLTNDGTLG